MERKFVSFGDFVVGKNGNDLALVVDGLQRRHGMDEALRLEKDENHEDDDHNGPDKDDDDDRADVDDIESRYSFL